MAPSSSFAIAVDPIALVRTECITITSALRKHCHYFLSLEQTSLEKVSTIQAHHLDDYASCSGMLFASKPPPFCAEDNDTHDVGKWWRTHRFKCQNMQSQDASLVSLFDQLQTQLKNFEDIRSFDSPTLLYPFLQVLCSSTPVAITTLALLALTKIFSYRIIDEHSQNFPGCAASIFRNHPMSVSNKQFWFQ
jgi:brefeldin A-resistance guanine nucleotide exchange factor 1